MVGKPEIIEQLRIKMAERRLAKGLSQRDVSERLGYTSPQFISNFERGLCLLPLKKLRVLADLYEMDRQEVADLLLEAQRSIIYSELKVKKAK